MINQIHWGNHWLAVLPLNATLVLVCSVDEPHLVGCCEFRGLVENGFIRGAAVMDFQTVGGNISTGDYLDGNPIWIQVADRCLSEIQLLNGTHPL